MKVIAGSKFAYLHKQSAEGLNALLDWWTSAGFDNINQRFYGEVDNQNIPNVSSTFCVIQRSRLLWFFSAVSQLESYGHFRKYADLQFKELITHFYDKEYGGFLWELNENYSPTVKIKKTYAQAFCIYALSEYSSLTNNKEAKDIALETYNLLESKTWDTTKGGYIEAFDQQWDGLQDMRLSQKDQNEAKTMNTHLHILEAYTRLSVVCEKQEVKLSLTRVLSIYHDKFFNPVKGHFDLFFDHDWNLKSNIISYGHDIESAWLMREAIENIEDYEIECKVENLSIKIADRILQMGLEAHGGIKNEVHNNRADTTFDWWPQAEAVVGFLNIYDASHDEKYFHAAINCMKFIQENFFNIESGEWYWKINEQLQPEKGLMKSSAWKAPYHNGRMYIEILKRQKKLEAVTNTGEII